MRPLIRQDCAHLARRTITHETTRVILQAKPRVPELASGVILLGASRKETEVDTEWISYSAYASVEVLAMDVKNASGRVMLGRN